MSWVELYLIKGGLGWAVAGAMLAVMLGGVGSAIGIRISGSQGSGVLSEKPDLFGKLLVLMALPGTQGFYGFIGAVLIARYSGLLGAEGVVTVSPQVGLCLFLIGVCMGVVLWRSAVMQGEAAASAINLVARRPDQAGRAIVIPALVETYAVVALLAATLMIIWVTKDGLKIADPAELLQTVPVKPAS
jgi:V/A-type H+-transporting ATPase subunit K